MDRVFAIAGDWAVASDGIQWTLIHRKKAGGGRFEWRPKSFIRSTRDILERCMREKGVEAVDARLLLAELPDTFDQWKTRQAASEPRLTSQQHATSASVATDVRPRGADAFLAC